MVLDRVIRDCPRSHSRSDPSRGAKTRQGRVSASGPSTVRPHRRGGSPPAWMVLVDRYKRGEETAVRFGTIRGDFVYRRRVYCRSAMRPCLRLIVVLGSIAGLIGGVTPSAQAKGASRAIVSGPDLSAS